MTAIAALGAASMLAWGGVIRALVANTMLGVAVGTVVSWQSRIHGGDRRTLESTFLLSLAALAGQVVAFLTAGVLVAGNLGQLWPLSLGLVALLGLEMVVVGWAVASVAGASRPRPR